MPDWSPTLPRSGDWVGLPATLDVLTTNEGDTMTTDEGSVLVLDEGDNTGDWAGGAAPTLWG